MTKVKEQIMYTPSPHWEIVKVGLSAIILPLSPLCTMATNKPFLLTTLVISHDKETGDFETEDKVYKAVK